MIKTVDQASLRDSVSIALIGDGTCAEQGNGDAVAKNRGRAVGHGDAHIALGEHRAIVQLHGNADEKVNAVGTPIHAAILKPRGSQKPESQRKLDKGRTPRLGLCELPLAAECRWSRLPLCVLVEEDVWAAIDH